MMEEGLLDQITSSIVDGDPDRTLQLTEEAISAGLSPLRIIEEGLTPGMTIVGDKFGAGEYYLPNLLIAAKAMQGAMGRLEPLLKDSGEEVKSKGIVVIGTVSGDIHEIGKSLVATMLTANGFEVHDLGVDVDTEAFVEKVSKLDADILGLSALLTTTMTRQREVIEALEDAGLRERVRVILGGAPVTAGWSAEIGADGYAEDAMGAVRLSEGLLQGET
jgi:corrinoid protein of di/trimethylamine methyltransferase